MELFLCVMLSAVLAGFIHLRRLQIKEDATANVALIINARTRADLRHMPFGLGSIATRLPMWVSEFAILSWYHRPVFVKSVIIQGKERRVRATVIGVANTARVMNLLKEQPTFGDLAEYFNTHVAWEAAREFLQEHRHLRWLGPAVTRLQKHFVGWIRNWERRHPGLTPMDLAVNDIVEAVRQAKRRYGATSFVLTGFTGTSVFAAKAFDLVENNPELNKLVRSTGNHPLPGVVCEATLSVAANQNIVPADVVVGVVGATGSIGRGLVTMLAPQVRRVVATGRKKSSVAIAIKKWGLPGNVVAGDVTDLKAAHIILVATSDTQPVVRAEHISEFHRVVLNDVSEPKGAPELRSGGLLTVLDGGKVYVVDGRGRKTPCPFAFDPKNPLLWPACAAEGIATASTGRYDLATSGATLGPDECVGMAQLFKDLGFQVEPGWRHEPVICQNDWWDRVPALQRARKKADSLASATTQHAAA